MSKPTAGNYYIIQRSLSPTGDKLAITFNGENELLTITPFASEVAQLWTIVNYNDVAQSVSPLGNLTLQAFPNENFMAVITRVGSVFAIRGGNGQPYTIHDGLSGPANWAVTTATDGAKIAWGDNTGAFQEWILQSA